MTEKHEILERLAQDFFDEEIQQLVVLIEADLIDIWDSHETSFWTNEQRQAAKILARKVATYINEECLTRPEVENISISKSELLDAIMKRYGLTQMLKDRSY